MSQTRPAHGSLAQAPFSHFSVPVVEVCSYWHWVPEQLRVREVSSVVWSVQTGAAGVQVTAQPPS